MDAELLGSKNSEWHSQHKYFWAGEQSELESHIRHFIELHPSAQAQNCIFMVRKQRDLFWTFNFSNYTIGSVEVARFGLYGVLQVMIHDRTSNFAVVYSELTGFPKVYGPPDYPFLPFAAPTNAILEYLDELRTSLAAHGFHQIDLLALRPASLDAGSLVISPVEGNSDSTSATEQGGAVLTPIAESMSTSKAFFTEQELMQICEKIIDLEYSIELKGRLTKNRVALYIFKFLTDSLKLGLGMRHEDVAKRLNRAPSTIFSDYREWFEEINAPQILALFKDLTSQECDINHSTRQEK